MRNSPQHLTTSAAKRCAICNGKFGLIRHYSWRTSLCSRKCVDRFTARRESDASWLGRFSNRTSFVLVNGSAPCPQSFCAPRCELNGTSYLSEIGRRLSYCNPSC
jgi:hypothetical protein